MLNKKKENFKKIFYTKTLTKWWLSYALILILGLIFALSPQLYTENTLKNKLDTANRASLDGAQNFVDHTINSIIDASAALSFNKDISELASLNTKLTNEQKYEMLISDSIWRGHELLFDYIARTYIYFPDSDSIYTGTTITPRHHYYLTAYKNEQSIENNIWHESVLMKNTSGFISVPYEEGQRIFYVFPTCKFDRNLILYNVIVEINFTEILEDASDKIDNELFVCSKDGKIFTSINPMIEQSVKLNDFLKTNKLTVNISDSSGHYVMMKSRISSGNWVCGALFDKSSYFFDLSMAQIYRLIALAFFILLGLILITYFTHLSNKPLDDILNTLALEKDDLAHIDTHTYINTAIRKMIDENKNKTSIDAFHKQTNILKEYILLNILYGSKNDNLPYDEQLKLVDLNIESPLFATIVFAPKDISKIFYDETHSIPDSEKHKHFSLIVSNILSESLSVKYSCETIKTDNFVVAIINFSHDQSIDFKSNVSKILISSFEIIKNEFNINVYAAVSSTHISLSNLNTAYNESIMCMQHSMTNNIDIIFHDEISELGFSEDNFHMNNPIDEIVQCLETQQYKKCKKLVENYIYKFQQATNPPIEIVRVYTANLLNVFYNHIVSCGDSSIDYLSDFRINSFIASCNSIPNIMLKTMTVINRYLDDVVSGSDSDVYNKPGKRVVYSQITQYIEEHYSDSILSVSEIASIFKTNSSYLSSQFKKEYGIGLQEYISSVRINAAKKLLTTTNKTNDEIAYLVGYTNTRTFLRVFSKSEGITPKEFRMQYEVNIES